MTKIDNILTQVGNNIIPTYSDRRKITRITQDLIKKLSFEFKKSNIIANITVEGSVAKDTWLREDPDIDIFVHLPLSLSKEDFKNILKIAKKATKNSKHIERYADHPYLETFIDDIRVNIVPCYIVKKGNWKSATDRTAFHTKYINKHLKPELKNEVRLLKKFFKGINVYGAEIKTSGFSGYLCELLILKYKSFIKTIKIFSKFKTPIIIDQNKYYSDKKIDLAKIFFDPIIVIDPIDKNRNVASAVKSKKLYTLIGAARAFLLKPSVKFFSPPNIDSFTTQHLKENLENRGSSVLFIILDNINSVPDVLWGQLYKTQKTLGKLLKQNDFKILRNEVWTDERTLIIFVIELETVEIPNIKCHIGPPLRFEKQCDIFLSKHMENPSVISGPYIQNKRWIILSSRTFFNAKDLLEEKLTNYGQNIGIPKLISKAFQQNMRILINDEIMKIYKQNSEFAVFLSSFLIGKPFWLES